jgi:hypothetical protein
LFDSAAADGWSVPKAVITKSRRTSRVLLNMIRLPSGDHVGDSLSPPFRVTSGFALDVDREDPV